MGNLGVVCQIINAAAFHESKVKSVCPNCQLESRGLGFELYKHSRVEGPYALSFVGFIVTDRRSVRFLFSFHISMFTPGLLFYSALFLSDVLN